jgi:hypothetical protein
MIAMNDGEDGQKSHGWGSSNKGGKNGPHWYNYKLVN